MAPRLRRNHQKAKNANFGRVILFALVFMFALGYLFKLIGQLDIGTKDASGNDYKQDHTMTVPPVDGCYLVDHDHFILCYSEDHEQAIWTSHVITREALDQNRVERYDWFAEDPSVPTKSAHHRDYKSSKMTRGHLVPAADMAHSMEAMERSFYMSNISPQPKAFNGGIWRELEELCRDWARLHDAVYVVSGPIFKKDEVTYIGKTSSIAVPDAFFKAVLNEDMECVGFVIPNKVSVDPIWSYAMTIDSLEEILGIDLFADKMSSATAEEVESVLEPDSWPLDEQRFELRITDWNIR